ncbi:hypothetical protein DPMN_110035 [Dreissena polymorpha]|uniref:Uncharacterized protein n=1 Tax=Dreissena polymorpha TaxID=45954 RepID=A0A9D4KBW2_DREPO|nr:hypothetical protein DPMN_110035 [Dreissena polymorpha]
MNYASTYMGAWETELFSKSNKHPIAYFRFVDDVWGLWTHGLEALKMRSMRLQMKSIHEYS